ncbi:MAG: succinate dehydrogenase, cytochrome b556 subunit [Robiginitomaculum sp.]|nr:MAG: succinate dehydrogenase, cytochrome b556 subunit [Robiginitomaculum sp.]
MAKGWNDKRPMSPHMSVWKWHPAMLSSILHRGAVVILYIALIKICIWLALFALGDASFEAVKGLIYSPLGAFAFFVFSAALVYHALADLRHLMWDAGKGYAPEKANAWSIILLVLAVIIATVLTYCLVGSFK